MQLQLIKSRFLCTSSDEQATLLLDIKKRGENGAVDTGGNDNWIFVGIDVQISGCGSQCKTVKYLAHHNRYLLLQTQRVIALHWLSTKQNFPCFQQEI